MGKSTISMAIFNYCVKLPEGKPQFPGKSGKKTHGFSPKNPIFP